MNSSFMENPERQRFQDSTLLLQNEPAGLSQTVVKKLGGLYFEGAKEYGRVVGCS